MITGEFRLIDLIKEKVNRTQGFHPGITGIGDDCAVYRISHNRYGLFSTDISIEDVHFDLSYTSLFNAGYRSMTANISDIYAMGGNPVLALVSAGIPPHFTDKMADELYDGILECAGRYNTYIAGGDTSKSDKLVINISIYGETASPVFRKGAKPGDSIYVTGNTGLSRLGLEILQTGADISRYPRSVEKHLKPESGGKLIGTIIDDYSPTSMIDISDGLLMDLGHICSMNGCGFELFEERLPADMELKDYCTNKNISISEYSLYSGEEYELLFTSEKEITGNRLITHIGSITAGGFFLVSGESRRPVITAGYDHFKTKEGV